MRDWVAARRSIRRKYLLFAFGLAVVFLDGFIMGCSRPGEMRWWELTLNWVAVAFLLFQMLRALMHLESEHTALLRSLKDASDSLSTMRPVFKEAHDVVLAMSAYANPPRRLPRA